MDLPKRSARLLVVDDSQRSRDVLRECLETNGYRVATAHDGGSANSHLAQAEFDLVLLDINMPGVDGWDVLRQIRGRYAPSALPVIMATACDQGEDIIRAFREGANDYVTKPIDLTVALARIETHLALKDAIERTAALQRDLELRNAALEDANAKMKRDLIAAARVQRGLLPSVSLPIPGISFAWLFHPCDELGGDILNFFRLGPMHVGFYLLDVSGHGVSAALMSVSLSRLLTPLPEQNSLVQRNGANGERHPVPSHELAEILNRQFVSALETEQYFTFFYGLFDLRSGVLRCVNAGHPKPILVRSGDVIDITSPDVPIGLDDGTHFREQSIAILPGDRLYLFSDGITEAADEARRLFGRERISRVLLDRRDVNLNESLDLLMTSLAEWVGGRVFEDDVSALAIEFGPR